MHSLLTDSLCAGCCRPAGVIEDRPEGGVPSPAPTTDELTTAALVEPEATATLAARARDVPAGKGGWVDCRTVLCDDGRLSVINSHVDCWRCIPM